MTTAWTLKTAPVFDVVSLDVLKDHLRVTHANEDALIAAYAVAAREWVEHYTGRALCTQTWQMSLSQLPRVTWLPRAAPLQTNGITFVKYYDADNVLQTWASSNYITPAFTEPASIEWVGTATLPSVYCRSDAWQIEYVCGYAEGACPQSLVSAVLTLTAHFYENREAVLVSAQSKEVEFAVTALCSPYRVWWRAPECR